MSSFSLQFSFLPRTDFSICLSRDENFTCRSKKCCIEIFVNALFIYIGYMRFLFSRLPLLVNIFVYFELHFLLCVYILYNSVS